METSLGEYLRRERERQGVALAEIAAETKIPEASLLFIEEENGARWHL